MTIHGNDKGLRVKKGRYEELDVFRGLAALAVMSFHYTVSYTQIYDSSDKPLFNGTWGMYGVQMFFMISGFVIFMTLEKTARPLDFVVSRFSRLYPCYWVAALLTYFILKKFWFYPDMQLYPVLAFGKPLKEFLVNLTMCQYWLHLDNIDPSYWTLAGELLFYGLMFAVFITKNLKNMEWLALGWLAVMALNKFFTPHGKFIDGLMFTFNVLLFYGEFFISGILFYNLKTKGNAWWRHLGIGLCVLVSYFVSGAKETTIFVYMVAAFYLFIFGWLVFIVQKPLVFLGTISYSFYLVHQELGYVIKGWLKLFYLNPFWNFFIPMACSILVAALLTFLVEKPAMAGIRSVYRSFKERNLSL